MKKQILISIIFTMIMCFSSSKSKADIVELDLFALGCPTEITPHNSQPSDFWSPDFDLGTSFSQISHVYIEWAGEFKVGKVVLNHDIENPIPVNVGVLAWFRNPMSGIASIHGGLTTYPASESFDCVTEFKPLFVKNWSELLDGKGNIAMEYDGMIFPLEGGGYYIDYGSITLSKAILRVEGTVAPEPATLSLFAGAALLIRTFSKKLKKTRSLDGLHLNRV